MFLLDKVCCEDDEDNGEVADYEYAIKEDMILLKGGFDLECDADEDSIRSELRKVFMKKFPLICNDNFDFVKRDRNTICTPVVKEGHVWDYPHVKHLCGAGKLYVRLNISKALITMDDTGSESSDVEIEQMIDLTSPSTSLRQTEKLGREKHLVPSRALPLVNSPLIRKLVPLLHCFLMQSKAI